MPKNQQNSNPPPRMPGLDVVPTGEVIKDGNKTYKVLKLAREGMHEEVTRPKSHKAPRPSNGKRWH